MKETAVGILGCVSFPGSWVVALLTEKENGGFINVRKKFCFEVLVFRYKNQSSKQRFARKKIFGCILEPQENL